MMCSAHQCNWCHMGHSGMTLERIWDESRMTIGSFCEHSENILGSFWDYSGITLKTLWDQPGITLGTLGSSGVSPVIFYTTVIIFSLKPCSILSFAQRERSVWVVGCSQFPFEGSHQIISDSTPGIKVGFFRFGPDYFSLPG